MNENILKLTPYEMLRAVRALGLPATVLEREFFFCRPTQSRVLKLGNAGSCRVSYKTIDALRAFLIEHKSEAAELRDLLDKVASE